MPSYKFIIIEEAISEIADYCLYYNIKNPGLSFEFEEEVFRLLEIIKDNPLLFPIKFAHIHEAVVTRFPFAKGFVNSLVENSSKPKIIFNGIN